VWFNGPPGSPLEEAEVKFGLLFRPQDPPDGANLTRRWSEILETGKLAEDVGFDGLFLPEHHMMDDGYPPAPLIGLGALAAVTKRVDLGTTILLLPFYNPVQVAEHAAMVDVISDGRMVLGVGVGNFEPEFQLFGRTSANQIALFEESIDIIRRLWRGEEVDHHSEHFDVKGKLRPLPKNARMWLGAMSFPGVRRAARLGAPWPTDPLHNIEVIKEWADAYRAEGEKQGTSDDLSLVLLRDGWVGDDMEQVERDWWPAIRAEHWFYFSQIPRWVADREPFLQGIASESDFRFENHHVDRLVVGSPEQCLETIRRFEDRVGNDYLIMSFRVAAGPDHDKEMECVERFGKEVIARYRAEGA
jgi:alkanesulfonate monooxygenase SsuD/methylene tetrahydromethanopterin reductase-like flavin-dependent oxidoreductase (luciferase family)